LKKQRGFRIWGAGDRDLLTKFQAVLWFVVVWLWTNGFPFVLPPTVDQILVITQRVYIQSQFEGEGTHDEGVTGFHEYDQNEN
jgi:hypothetical protein